MYVRIRSPYRDAEIPLPSSSLSVLHVSLPHPSTTTTDSYVPEHPHQKRRDHLLPLPRFFFRSLPISLPSCYTCTSGRKASAKFSQNTREPRLRG